MTYTPRPLDTSQIKLSNEINELIELLARNAHENWASQRIADGWTYGPYRDDLQKKTPSLVEYEVLSESEKEYDRIMVMQTLKAIVALGYRVSKD
ncbi:MAG: RyR domain-containing protein [Ignavibacteriales bacterium]